MVLIGMTSTVDNDSYKESKRMLWFVSMTRGSWVFLDETSFEETLFRHSHPTAIPTERMMTSRGCKSFRNPKEKASL